MPHTSHRSRPRRHPTKQQQTTDEDGWTHVTRAPTARDAAKALARSSLTPAQPYTADASLTPTRLAADYASVLVRWRESEARGHALRFLAGTGVKIERAICVGLGAVGRSEGRWRTLWQLAMFCDLCDEGKCFLFSSRDGSAWQGLSSRRGLACAYGLFLNASSLRDYASRPQEHD